MAKLGRIIRAQYEDGGEWHNIPLEISSQLSIDNEMIEKSGTGRGQQLDKSRQGWSAVVVMRIDTPERLMGLVDMFAWPVKRWRLVTDENQHYTGNAWITKINLSAGLNVLVEAQLNLLGNGKLIRM